MEMAVIEIVQLLSEVNSLRWNWNILINASSPLSPMTPLRNHSVSFSAVMTNLYSITTVHIQYKPLICRQTQTCIADVLSQTFSLSIERLCRDASVMKNFKECWIKHTHLSNLNFISRVWKYLSSNASNW